jgi:hypothetical protein
MQQYSSRNQNGSSGKEGISCPQDSVMIRKVEVIEVLKTLEGLKRKLQALLK